MALAFVIFIRIKFYYMYIIIIFFREIKIGLFHNIQPLLHCKTSGVTYVFTYKFVKIYPLICGYRYNIFI